LEHWLTGNWRVSASILPLADRATKKSLSKASSTDLDSRLATGA